MTGHKSNKVFQEQKGLIKQFANDFGCSVSETISTLILEKDGVSIEMMPKREPQGYRDIKTNKIYEYYNATACLMKFFDVGMSHVG